MTDQNSSKREKFVIKVEEHEDFEPIAKTKFISSDKLCKLAAELFRGVFADFEGCVFEVAPNNGQFMLSLIFNHGEYDKDAVVACERVGGKSSGSSIIDRTRARDVQLAEGDRYTLTEDGKDAIKSLLIPRMYNQGNPNWKQIVSEWVDRTPVNIYQAQVQPHYTKVSFIDLDRLVSLIYGAEENGDTLDYRVTIAGATMNPAAFGGMQIERRYMLSITCASAKEVNKVYAECGFGTMGTSIVR